MDDATRQRVDNALRGFWGVRDTQFRAASLTDNAQGGNRSAVVGGGHLDAVRDLIAEEFERAGIPSACIHRRGRAKVLPGWFRPTKNWDLAVTSGADVAAAVELKSQVGSMGNNANNRAEEAIGNAVDVEYAFERGLLGDIRPWLGYVYITEDVPMSRRPSVRRTNAHYDQRPIFTYADAEALGVSYVDRLALLGRELVDAGLYQAAWIAVTSRPSRGEFGWEDASPTVSYDGFQQAISDLAADLA